MWGSLDGLDLRWNYPSIKHLLLALIPCTIDRLDATLIGEFIDHQFRGFFAKYALESHRSPDRVEIAPSTRNADFEVDAVLLGSNRVLKQNLRRISD